MPTVNASKRIDDYINKSGDFAKPICKKIRAIIHKAEPEIIEEWKWGPNFQKNGMVCGFWGFKSYVNFFFFRGVNMKDPKKIFTEGGSNRWSRGLKIRDIKEVNEKVFVSYIKEAVKINSKPIDRSHKEIPVPADLSKLLNNKQKEHFDSLSYTHRKEYVVWIESAKKQETREARLKKAVELLSKKIKTPN
jgi:hypothetical protein